MIEKPLGQDLALARAPNDEWHHVLAGDQIFDYFSGKQSVLVITLINRVDLTRFYRPRRQGRQMTTRIARSMPSTVGSP